MQTIQIGIVGNGYILSFRVTAPATTQRRELDEAVTINALLKGRYTDPYDATVEIQRVFNNIEDPLAYLGVYLQSQNPSYQANTIEVKQ